MKLSEMSDESCSRWICEKLEPLPIPFSDGIVGLSPLKCWTCSDYWRPEWQPRDFVNDPMMWSMLLEQSWPCIMVSSRVGDGIRIVKPHPNDSLWHVQVMTPSGVKPFAKNERLGRAIAEAWMKANGWEPEMDKTNPFAPHLRNEKKLAKGWTE